VIAMMRRGLRRSAVGALPLVLLFGSQGVAAAPTAKEHAQRARALDKEGRFDEAIREYEKAYELSHDPLLIFNVALEYRKDNQRQKALEAFTRYVTLVPGDPSSDEARSYIAALRREIDEEEASQAKAREAAAEPVAILPTTTTVPAARDHSDAPAPGKRQRLTSFIVGGAGIAAIAAGTIVVILAHSDWEASRAGCDADNVCTDSAYDQATSARSKATVATVLFGAGIAAVATGTVLYFMAPSASSAERAARWRVTPTFTGGTAGVAVTAGF